MLLTRFCEIQEAQATSRIQFGLLTAKIKHNRTQKQTNSTKTTTNKTTHYKIPSLNAFKDKTWHKALTFYSSHWHRCRGL